MSMCTASRFPVSYPAIRSAAPETVSRASIQSTARQCALSTMTTITLPHLPSHPVHAFLFEDVQNCAFLRQQLLEGNADFEYAFLDAATVRTHRLRR